MLEPKVNVLSGDQETIPTVRVASVPTVRVASVSPWSGWPQSPLADLHLTFKLTEHELISLLPAGTAVPGEETAPFPGG